jgi:inorganic phosphate transporter, PiT family
MTTTLTLVVVIIAVALLFDFFNGFNDAANSIATIVATKVLTPLQAVIWAAFFNFVSAFSFGTGVAQTVGAGMVNLDMVTPYVILAGLLGGTVWLFATSMLGLPVSASHALFGGYAGAAMGRVAYVHGVENTFDAIVWFGWIKTLIFMVFAPLLGLALAYILMILVYWLFRGSTPKTMDVYFRRLQLLSAAIFSYSHGTNDAQKTMGIITGALVTGGFLETFKVPIWVIFSAHAMIALGTMMGGWRVVQTLGHRVTRLKPRTGFCAETAGALSILFATGLKVGVSTTHVITGAVFGVGSIQRPKSVRWKLARHIVGAWILTIPVSATSGWLLFHVMRMFIAEA